jgi:hypothetical protein
MNSSSVNNTAVDLYVTAPVVVAQRKQAPYAKVAAVYQAVHRLLVGQQTRPDRMDIKLVDKNRRLVFRLVFRLVGQQTRQDRMDVKLVDTSRTLVFRLVGQ